MYDAKKILAKQEIKPDELERLLCMREDGLADFLLIDVREKYEYIEKRIVGVDCLIPLSDFFVKVTELEKEKSKPIIIQCKSGARSAQAQAQLKLLGFEAPINLVGGITKYKGKTEGKE
tara:strand:+ start:37 stop:393 length:357 start_codon:yes stop_codon:yes gene_type:complete